MADHFNAIEYAHQLESAGVPAAQAEVHASALSQVVESCLSAATDTKNIRSELSYKISTLEVTLRAEIRELETTLRAELRELETKLGARMDKLEIKMNERFRWQWWANGAIAALLIGLYFR
jgi:chromosome segregation ATPase